MCDGANGWKCQGGKAPTPEVCDDVDNNCNGTKDDGLGSPVGDSCGTNVGECTLGVNICDKGIIKCNGQGGTAEICDGKDNDCDGTIDNGLPIGGSCTPTYDTNLYPGDRTKGECKPGVNQCDPQNPTQPLCVGGQGPEPEVCDGKDNDCDGQIDESGPAPDGIDGTTNPLDPCSEDRRRLRHQRGRVQAGHPELQPGQIRVHRRRRAAARVLRLPRQRLQR